MRRWVWTAVTIGILTMPLAVVDARDTGINADPIAAIETDYLNDQISLDEYVLLVVKAVRFPGQLPDDYRSLSLSEGKSSSRRVSMLLKEILDRFEELSPTTQQAFRLAFARWETDSIYISPGGFYKLHYNIAPDSNGVPPVDDDFSGVPDFVEKCAAYCDTSFDRHIELGYMVPPSDGILGGDSLFDIYFQEMAYYGYAVPEVNGPMPWNDRTSYVVLNNDFLGFAPNQDPEGSQWGAAKATVAHEYHHSVQYAYDAGEETWYMESDAVFMEEMVFDEANDCYNYLDEFFAFPQKSLMLHSDHYYSCFIWELFLAEKFDTSLMRAAWEGSLYGETVFEALSDTMYGRYVWTADSAFGEFTVWNFCTSIRDDGEHHEEGVGYPLVAVGLSHSSYPVPFQNSPSQPAGYGCSYVQFYPGSDTGTFVLNFNGSDSREWSAWVIKSTAENVHEFEKITLASGSFHGTLEVPHFEDYYRITLAGANTSEYSSSVAYTYQAAVQPPYELASQLMSPDTIIYSGHLRQYGYLVQNLAPLGDVVDVIFWDEHGWVAADTIDKALAPGADTVFSIAVRPPQGTPIGDTATLIFAVVSHGDPSVADTQSVVVTTVLQAGDLDFDGYIDISDLVYFVDYAFNGGPPPIPVLASGDFLCDGGIDISDLVALVEYMFLAGDPPPCNPY